MAKLTDVLGRPHSGLVPWVVPAIVTDNVDPDELGRIQVKFPTLFDHNTSDMPLSFWLRQVSPNAGVERGLYALPEVDDEVLVVFMQGSQDVGVIIGQFWNGVDKPPKEAKDGLPGSGSLWGGNFGDAFADGSTALDKNDRRLWRSRSGHLLVFDDTDGSETVQIWNNSHTLCLAFDTAEDRIILSNSSGDIHIRTATDLYFEAGNDIKWYAGNNIEGESSVDTTFTVGGNWTTETTGNGEHKTTGNTKIEATGSVEIKATTSAKIEGLSFEGKGSTTATLKGGAMAEVKGAIVKIN